MIEYETQDPELRGYFRRANIGALIFSVLILTFWSFYLWQTSSQTCTRVPFGSIASESNGALHFTRISCRATKLAGRPDMLPGSPPETVSAASEQEGLS